MQKFNIKVTREDEFNISICPKIWDAEALKIWSKVFHEVDTTEELAVILSHNISKNGYDGFHEGFGYLAVKLKDGYQLTQFKTVNGDFRKCEPGDYCKGVEVEILTYNDDYDFETELIE